MQLQISHSGYKDGNAQFCVIRLDDAKHSSLVTLTSPEDMPLDNHTNKRLLPELQWYLEKYLFLPIGANITRSENVQRTLTNWGRECFKTLFVDRARDWFQSARRDGLENLHIKISSDDPVILAWPWEALNNDDDGYLAQRCCIERQLTTIGDVLPLPESLPHDKINILYIIARPYGEEDVGFHTLVRPLVDHVYKQKLPVHIDILRPPTFENLRHVLRAKQNFYHIVHFDGHGGYGGTKSVSGGYAFGSAHGMLVFEDKKGKESRVDADRLSQLLAEYRIPIMILNACQSAMIDENADGPTASVAASLLKAGIRSVAAMSYSLFVSGARYFIQSFYQRLFETGNVTEAMRVGRQAMYDDKKRVSPLGEYPLQDWIVPVLYQQMPSNETIISNLQIKPMVESTASFLPQQVLDIGAYGFIGRERDIQKLERAVLHHDQAGILIHGMAGTGKTTLVKGFLQWRNKTNGLEAQAYWFDFRDIHSVDYIIDELLTSFLGINALTLSDQEKLSRLTTELLEKQYFIVWDNFESASGIEGTEVSALLPPKDIKVLKNLLKELRGGKTKILITSRSQEEWLTVQDRYAVSLGGMNGEELWEYCDAVVNDFDFEIQRDNQAFIDLINKLDGNPLVIRAILLRLQERTVPQLLAEFNEAFIGYEGDDSTRRMQAAFDVFGRNLDKKFATILQLISLYEHYADADYIEYMLHSAGDETNIACISNCFNILESAGFCRHIGNRIYQLHPVLRRFLAQTCPALEVMQRAFVNIMSLLADELAPKEYHEQRRSFILHEANFYRASCIAQQLDMWEEEMSLTQSLALYAYNARHYAKAFDLFDKLALQASTHNNFKLEASAYHQLGMIAAARRDLSAAEEWYHKSLEISLRQGNEHGAAITYHQLGMIAEERRDLSAAEEWYHKSLEISLRQGNEHFAASTYHQLGRIAEERRDLSAAEEWYHKSLEIELRQGNEHGAAITYGQLGNLYFNIGDYEASGQFYLKSIVRFKASDDEAMVMNTTAKYVHLLKSSDGLIQEKLRLLWVKAGLEAKLLTKLEGLIHD